MGKSGAPCSEVDIKPSVGEGLSFKEVVVSEDREGEMELFGDVEGCFQKTGCCGGDGEAACKAQVCPDKATGDQGEEASGRRGRDRGTQAERDKPRSQQHQQETVEVKKLNQIKGARIKRRCVVLLERIKTLRAKSVACGN